MSDHERVQVQRRDTLGGSGGVWDGFGAKAESKRLWEALWTLTYIRKAGRWHIAGARDGRGNEKCDGMDGGGTDVAGQEPSPV